MSTSAPISGRKVASTSPQARNSLEEDVRDLQSGSVTPDKVMAVAKKHGMSVGDLFSAFPELFNFLMRDDLAAFTEALKMRQEKFRELIDALKAELKVRTEQFEEKYKEFLDKKREHPELLSPLQAAPPTKEDPLELKDRIPTSFAV